MATVIKYSIDYDGLNFIPGLLVGCDIALIITGSFIKQKRIN
jgi:hypothetical protein